MLVRATVTMMMNAPMTWFVEKTTAQLSSRPSLERTNQIAAKSLEQLTGSLKDTKSVMVSASRERETVIGTATVSKAWFVIMAGDWERISALQVGIQMFQYSGVKIELFREASKLKYTLAGPKTKNAIVTQWSEWSKCSNSACGTLGVTFRRRSCIPPEFGGYDCPSNTIWDQYKRCRGEPCPPTTDAPTTTEAPTTEAPTTEAPTTEAPTTAGPKSKAACNPATWEKFSWACCTKKDPCYVDEGDCDNDAECAGDLVCGKNNCPETFTVRRGKNRPDCCMKPEA